MKLITQEEITKIQRMLIKGVHPSHTWEDINKALLDLHQLKEEEISPSRNAENWEEMEATDTMMGKKNDTGKDGNTQDP